MTRTGPTVTPDTGRPPSPTGPGQTAGSAETSPANSSPTRNTGRSPDNFRASILLIQWGAQPEPGRTSSAAPGRRPAMSISAAPSMAGLTPCATASKAEPYMTKGASTTTILSTMKMTMRSGRTSTPTQLTQTTSIKRRPLTVSKCMECRHRRFIARTRGHRT